MRKLLLLLLLAQPLCAQQNIKGTNHRKIFTSGGGGNPAFVNSGGNFSGGGTSTASVTAGNHLVVWAVAADLTTTHTCSDGANTYVDDGNISDGTGEVGHFFHVKTIASTTTITITCNGTTPQVSWIQYSGGTGDLDTTSVGTNPSGKHSGTPITPTGFTQTTANVILVDGYASTAGGIITLSQIDGSFTTVQSALNGTTSFIGAIGYRVVSATASYTDGWTVGGGASDQIAMLAAYK